MTAPTTSPPRRPAVSLGAARGTVVRLVLVLVACAALLDAGPGAPSRVPAALAATPPGPVPAPTTSLPAVDPASTATVVPVATTTGPTPTATSVPVPAGAQPQVDVLLTLTSLPGAAEVEVGAVVTGIAPRTADATGALSVDGGIAGVVVDFGDGSQDGRDGNRSRCEPTAPLGVLSFSDLRTHTYAKPGTYTLTYTVSTCAPGSTAAVAHPFDLVVDVAQLPAAGSGGTVNLELVQAVDAGRRLVLGATASGTAPQAYVAGTRKVTPTAGVVGFAVDFGDGSSDDSGPPAATCASTGAAATLTYSDSRTHTYSKAGTYTVSYTLLTCEKGTDRTASTTRTVSVTVR